MKHEWISSDEERLLLLYRDFMSPSERDELLCSITRAQFASYLDVSNFDKHQAITNCDYLQEEIEKELKLIASMDITGKMGNFFCIEPYHSILYQTAWGNIASVIFGSCDNDGARADELYNTALKLLDQPRTVDFCRKNALELIEAWREEVFNCLNAWEATKND